LWCRPQKSIWTRQTSVQTVILNNFYQNYDFCWYYFTGLILPRECARHVEGANKK
jgi:hypothetical protein